MSDTQAQQTAVGAFEPILTAEEVAERLQLPAETIYEFTRRRRSNPIPVLRAGKFLRFHWSAVERWMANAKPAPRKPYKRRKKAA